MSVGIKTDTEFDNLRWALANYVNRPSVPSCQPEAAVGARPLLSLHA